MDSLQIPEPIWKALLHELRQRGFGIRESGAFLLAKIGANRAIRFVCYDDLDPTALDSGIIVFQGRGFVPLWKLCTNDQLHVVADIHTHPGAWTGQSLSDSTHPMISHAGHIALIVPSFALNKRQRLRGVGIHEYLGNHQWRTWNVRSKRVVLTKNGGKP